MEFAGVDGCRGGWIVALDLPLRFRLCPSWSEVAWLTENCRRVAVDMPIGLPLKGQNRDCDRAARRLLGPRRQSVFSAPAREYLTAQEFSEVRGMSLQSFYLLPKIRQLDEWITPERQKRVFEAHPELIFARLAGKPMPESKKSPTGLARRLELIGHPVLPCHWKRSQVLPDDLVDAMALLRCAQEPGDVLGSGQRDERGLLMEIHS